MKKHIFEDRESWEAFRMGKLTGSKLKSIVSKRDKDKKLIGYYQILAENLAEKFDGSHLEHGIECEGLAIERFIKETKKEVETGLIVCTRSDEPRIAVSPDGIISKTEMIECKCLMSANHLKTLIENEVPDEFRLQTIQYFVVNEDLKTLHVVFFDPRMSVKDYFVIKINRKDVEKEIAESLEIQKVLLKELDEQIKKFTF